jgi:hypothetical protein
MAIAVAIGIAVAFAVKLTIVIAKVKRNKNMFTVDLPFFHHNGNGSKQRRWRPDKAMTVVTIAVLLANGILATVNIFEINPHTTAMALAITAPAVEAAAQL